MTFNDKAGSNLRCEVDARLPIEHGEPNDVIGIGAGRPHGERSIGHESTSNNALRESRAIPARDAFGKGQLVHDAVGHTELVNVMRGVGTNHGSSRLIDALARKVATQTAFLARQTRFHIDDFALVGAIDNGQQAHPRCDGFLDRVIDQTGRHDLELVLQIVLLGNFGLGHAFLRAVGPVAKIGRSIVLKIFEFKIRAHNVLQSRRQIIFRAHFRFARKIRRPNARRRHNLQSHHQIARLNIVGKAQNFGSFLGHSFQNGKRLVRQKTFLDKGLKFGRLFDKVLGPIGRVQKGPVATNLIRLTDFAMRTDLLGPNTFRNGAQALFAGAHVQKAFRQDDAFFGVAFFAKKFRLGALPTDASEDHQHEAKCPKTLDGPS